MCAPTTTNGSKPWKCSQTWACSVCGLAWPCCEGPVSALGAIDTWFAPISHAGHPLFWCFSFLPNMPKPAPTWMGSLLAMQLANLSHLQVESVSLLSLT